MTAWIYLHLIRWIGVGMLWLGLVACTVPNQPSPAPVHMARPTVALRPTAAIRLTSMPTPTTRLTVATIPSSPVTQERGPEGSWARFEGCWVLETEEVSFEIRLKQQHHGVRGSFLLVKLCVVADELSACRIREGTLQGRAVARETLELRLAIPEYDDEGTARLTLAADGATLRWEELDYPILGLADGKERYLPPSFALVPCGR